MFWFLPWLLQMRGALDGTGGGPPPATVRETMVDLTYVNMTTNSNRQTIVGSVYVNES